MTSESTDLSDVSEIADSMALLLDRLVESVPGVRAAIVTSSDGFVLSSHTDRLPGADPASIGAMSSAAVGLSNRLVGVTGDSPAVMSHHRSSDGQVFVLPIVHVAVLTVLATHDAPADQIEHAGRDTANGFQRLFRSAAAVSSH